MHDANTPSFDLPKPDHKNRQVLCLSKQRRRLMKVRSIQILCLIVVEYFAGYQNKAICILAFTFFVAFGWKQLVGQQEIR